MAGNTISVGLNIGDVKTAGLELAKILQGNAAATLDLAEAQAKYNKSGQQVGTVLKGMTDAGDRYTISLKQTGAAYELVNAQIIKAKAATQALTQAQIVAAAETKIRENAEAAAIRATVRAIEEKAAAHKKLIDGLSSAGYKAPSLIAGLSQSGREAAANGGGPSGRSIYGSDEEAIRAAGKDQGLRSRLPPPTKLPDPDNGGNIDKAKKASERLLITWQGIVRLVQAQIFKKLFIGISEGLSQSITDARRFSIAIAEIQTISQDVPLSTAKWTAELTKLSSAFGVTQLDVAAGAYETLSNQTAKGADTFKFLETALKFGAATVSSTKDSVNLLSGAINSFRLPVEDAERVASVLFKTIELGRVKAKDLADTFGRVGALAGEVGIKIEEVGAAIATISVKGVTPAETLTLINNVILKLLRPTEAMKTLFTEWGVANGQAAIAAFGFGGVLQKLSIEAQKGGGRLGDLENNIRSLRGAMALTGPGFEEYKRNLDKINNSGPQDYKNAQQLVLQSPGKQLEISGQKIRNFFEQDFGSKVIDSLNAINNVLETSKGAFDGLERGIQLVIAAVTLAANGFAIYKILMITNNALTIAGTTANLGYAASIRALAIDVKTLGASLKTISPLIAAVAAGYALGEYLQSSPDSLAKITADLKKKQVEWNSKDTTVTRQQQEDRSLTREIRGELEKRYQFLIQYSASVLQQANSLKQRTIDNYKDITDSVKVTAKTYFDSITNKISSLRQVVTEADALIKASLKRSEDYRRSSQQTVFDTRFKFADAGRLDAPPGAIPQIVEDQKTELLQNRIATLLKQARQKAASPDKETFQESKKLYDDVQRLQAQLFEIKTNNEKRIFDEKVNRGQVAPTRYVIDPKTGELKAQFQFIVETVEYEKQLNGLASERLAKERQFRQIQRERAEGAEKEIAREKERLRLLQQAFGEIEKIEVFDKSGAVKKEYAGPDGAGKAAKQFDEQAAKIRGLAGKESFGTQFQVFADLQKQRQALVQQVEQANRTEQAKTEQESIIRNKDAALKQVDEAGSTLSKSREITKKGLDALEVDTQAFKKKFVDFSTDPVKIAGRFLHPDKVQKLQEPQEKAQAALDNVEVARKAAAGDAQASKQIAGQLESLQIAKYQIYVAALKAQEEIKEYSKRGANGDAESTKTALREAAVAVDTAKREADLAIRNPLKLFLDEKIAELEAATVKFQKIKNDVRGDAPGKGFDEIYEQSKKLRQDSGQISNGAYQKRRGLQGLQEANDKAKELAVSMRDLPNFVEFFSKTIEQATPVISQSFGEVITEAKGFAEALRQISDVLRLQATQIPQERGNREDAGTKFFGGDMSYFAGGGPVFRPRGQDTVPAMLNKDEFVMTAAATKKFMPMLRAMNASPQYMNSGGQVTNVGDVNVTVNGGDTSDATIREIGAGLRRAIARGTVKLHG